MKRVNILKSALVAGLLCLGTSSFAYEGEACLEVFWQLAGAEDLDELDADSANDICRYGQGGGRVIHLAIRNGSPTLVKEFLLRTWFLLGLENKDTEGNTVSALARQTEGMEEVVRGLDIISAKQKAYENMIEECAKEHGLSCYMEISEEEEYFLMVAQEELEIFFFPTW